MSQIAYRGNLTSPHFPFLSRTHGQTIIVPGRDQAFLNQVIVQQDSEDKDKGFPQLYYCHNAMPTTQGIQSIGYTSRLPGIPGNVSFDDVYLLRDIDENKFLFSPAAGSNFVFNGNNNTWTSSGSAFVGSNTLVTVAYLNGRTFVFYEHNGMYEYNSTTGVFDKLVLTGVIDTNLKGVCASNGYLIVWDEFSIYRSDPLAVENFTPDPSVGAGASIPQDIRGSIIVCYPISNGFLIYTTQNVVSATFSKNIKYPFDYTEVQGSAGILDPQHVAWQSNIGVHYAWTIAGLQKIDKVRAQPVFPEVTDFLTAKLFEDYNELTDTLVETRLSSQLSLKVAVAGQRFFVISYGIGFPFTHALVYDLGLKRWGKLKLNHVCAFQYFAPNPYGVTTWEELNLLGWDDLGMAWSEFSGQVLTVEYPKETLALLQIDGTVFTVNFDDVHANDLGVAIFGKYQFVRERFITLTEIEIENVEQDNLQAPWHTIPGAWTSLSPRAWNELEDLAKYFDLRLLSSINGKTIDQITNPFLGVDTGQYKKYFSSVEAKNHSLAFMGTFDFVGLELKIIVGGRR